VKVNVEFPENTAKGKKVSDEEEGAKN